MLLGVHTIASLTSSSKSSHNVSYAVKVKLSNVIKNIIHII